MASIAELIREKRDEYGQVSSRMLDLTKNQDNLGNSEFIAAFDPLEQRADALVAEIESLETRAAKAKEADERNRAMGLAAAEAGNLSTRQAGGGGSGPGWIDRGSVNFSDDDRRQLEARAIQLELASALRAGGEHILGYEGRSHGKVLGIESRDMGLTTANLSTVGLTAQAVGTTFLGQVIEKIRDLSAFRSNCRVLTTPRGETMTIPRKTANSTAAWVEERGTFTTSDVGYDTITIGAHKYGFISIVSSELVQDETLAPNLLADLQADMVDAMGVLSNDAFVRGDGTNKPTGLVPALTSALTSSEVAGFTEIDLLDLQNSVAESVRRQGAYYLSRSAMHAVRGLRDLDGRPIWHPGVPGTEGGMPATIHGAPFVIDEALDTLSTGNAPVLFGNLAGAYVIRDVLGVEVRRSDEYRFDTDAVAFRIKARVDGRVRNADYMRKMVIG
jgi:HK97 family phage major capsid protein